MLRCSPCQNKTARSRPHRPPKRRLEFYLRYREAVLNATAMDDVLMFWRTEMVNEFKQAPPDQRADVDGIKRIYGTAEGRES